MFEAHGAAASVDKTFRFSFSCMEAIAANGTQSACYSINQKKKTLKRVESNNNIKLFVFTASVCVSVCVRVWHKRRVLIESSTRKQKTTTRCNKKNLALIWISLAKWILIENSKANNKNNYKKIKENNVNTKNKNKLFVFCYYFFVVLANRLAAMLAAYTASKLTITCPWQRQLFLKSTAINPPLKVRPAHNESKHNKYRKKQKWNKTKNNKKSIESEMKQIIKVHQN